MRITKSLLGSIMLPVLGAAVCGCGGSSGMVVFRDLADIPERPAVTARQMNDRAIETLMQDRARTAQAAEDLRNEPFATPEPAPTRPPP